MSQRVNLGEGCIPQQLQFRQGILEDGISDSAIDPQRFPIGRYCNAVGRSAGSRLSYCESPRLIRQLDPGDLSTFREIHHRESVKAAELDEDAVGGAIRLCLESHGAYGSIEFDFPSYLLGVEIDKHDSLVFYRPANRVLAIPCNEYIVHAAVHGNTLHPLQ